MLHPKTKVSGLISVSLEMSPDHAKFLPSLAELNSSKGIFLMKPSEVVKKKKKKLTSPKLSLCNRKLNPFLNYFNLHSHQRFYQNIDLLYMAQS